MKLFGKDITPEKVMGFVAERLEARGLVKPANLDVPLAGVEPRVDPLSFFLSALEANADATKGLPLETHRDGLGGRAVLMAKKAFRAAGQVFINEALGRQRVFNGHVRDSYAQLASEVLRLRQRVAELEAQQAVAPKAPVHAGAPAIVDASRLVTAPAVSAVERAPALRGDVEPEAFVVRPPVAQRTAVAKKATPVTTPEVTLEPRPTAPQRPSALGQAQVKVKAKKTGAAAKKRPEAKPRSGRRGG